MQDKGFMQAFQQNMIVLCISLCLAWVCQGHEQSVQQARIIFIFDCDGVLIDSEYAKFLAWQHTLQEYNLTYSLDEYLPVVGYSSIYIKKNIENLRSVKLPESFIETKNRWYKMLQSKGLPQFKETVAFVKCLGSLKESYPILIALVSSPCHEEIDHNIRSMGLDQVFDTVVSGEDDLMNYQDNEGTNKPKPYIYLEAAKRLGITDYNSCIVFEDTNAGVQAATSAGMKVIAIPNSFTRNHDFSHALVTINALSDLLTNSNSSLIPKEHYDVLFQALSRR